MIHTAKQLKDKVKNMSGGNGEVAQALIRTYFMERFLERVSVSEYRNNFILKGGMLVASIVGVDMRATMDIDTTVKALPLNEKDARAIIERIGELQLEDGVKFKITSVKEIMEEFDYPGIRMMIEANLERMRQPFKIDISTDDAITPGAVEYKYKLMFEDRSISVLSYNLETLLAEKMQTILARGLANTRMRDFYDVYEIMNSKADQISFDVLKKAFAATCMKRETSFGEEEVRETLDKIKDDSGLEEMWNRFKRVNYFVDDLPWGEISETIVDNIEKISFFSDQVSWISDEKDKILNINVNLSGRVNPDLGYSYSIFNFDERPLTDVISEKVGGYRVSIDNDTRAMIYGEYMQGVVKGEKNIIFINVSWGLGMGIIIDGKIYKGKSGFSGEFGHNFGYENEIICHCGKKGCIETEVSGAALHRILLEHINNGENSIISNTKKNLEDLTLDDIIDAVNKEDLLCIELVEEIGVKLGRHVAGLINIFNPELVIIGGALSRTGDYLTQPITTAIRKYTLNLMNRDSVIVESKLKERAGIIGACMLSRSKLFE